MFMLVSGEQPRHDLFASQAEIARAVDAESSSLLGGKPKEWVGREVAKSVSERELREERDLLIEQRRLAAVALEAAQQQIEEEKQEHGEASAEIKGKVGVRLRFMAKHAQPCQPVVRMLWGV